MARGLTYQFVLPATLAAPRQARRWVGAVCDGLSPAEVGVVELLTSELVTNAVLHPDPHGAADGEVWVVTLVLRRYPEVVRVEVHDHDSGRLPLRVDVEPSQESGWGLQLVEELAHEWGSLELAEGKGKAVWFEVRRDDRDGSAGVDPGD